MVENSISSLDRLSVKEWCHSLQIFKCAVRNQGVYQNISWSEKAPYKERFEMNVYLITTNAIRNTEK